MNAACYQYVGECPDLPHTGFNVVDVFMAAVLLLAFGGVAWWGSRTSG